MLKTLTPLLIFSCIPFILYAQEPEQDCINALPICFDSYTQPDAYSGDGKVHNEVSPTSCLATGEKNSVWYTFTVQNDGSLSFLITPNDLNDDYDWAVYNLTNASCKDIPTNPALEVSCNYSLVPGITGCLDSSGLTNNQGSTGIPYNSVIPVLQNEIYVIVISNFSSSQSGYTIDFTTSTASIFDVLPPSMTKIDSPVVCGSNKLKLHFSENILCSSIDLTDFMITGGSVAYAITAKSSTNCSALTTSYTRDVTFTVSPPFFGDELLKLELTGEILDVCANIGTDQKLNFSTNKSFAIATTANEVCEGTAAVLKATVTGTTSPYTYSFIGDGGLNITGSSSNQHTFLFSPAGTYYYVVTVKDKNGCNIAHADSVVVHPLPTLSTTADPACAGSPTVLKATVSGNTGPYTYSFTGDGGLNITGTASNQQSFTYPAVGTYAYTISVTDKNGCSSAYSDSARVLALPALVTATGEACAGTPALLNTSAGTGPYTYSFTGDGGLAITGASSGQQYFTYTIPGTYHYTVTATVGSCSDSKSDSVIVHAVPTINITAPEVCEGTPTAFTAVAAGGSGPYLYSFSGDGGLNIPTAASGQQWFVYPGAGAYAYTVQVTDQNGCSSILKTDTAWVGLMPQAAFSYMKQSDFDFTFLSSSANAATYQWSFGDGTTANTAQASHVYAAPGAYPVSLIVSSADGCSDTLTQVVTTNATPAVEYYLHVPNAFSPNGDGDNEQFQVKSAGITRFEMKIFDRWGGVVFKSSQPDRLWDGKAVNSTELLPSGVYIYLIAATFGDGTETDRTGTVTIQR